MRHIPEAETILAAVLIAHGPRCQCAGVCGRTHPAGTCGVDPYGRIIAAPAVPHTTEHENAATLSAELRPWCGPCWERAFNLARSARAEQLQRDLADKQLHLFEL